MTRSCRDLEYFIEVIYATQPWKVDPTIPAIPWVRLDNTGWPAARERVPDQPFGWSGENGKLRIGVWKDDGVCMPVKPVRRAMDVVVEKLEKDGRFELVEYTSFQQEEGWELIVSVRQRGTSFTVLLPMIDRPPDSEIPLLYGRGCEYQEFSQSDR
jgi:amidase